MVTFTISSVATIFSQYSHFYGAVFARFTRSFLPHYFHTPNRKTVHGTKLSDASRRRSETKWGEILTSLRCFRLLPFKLSKLSRGPKTTVLELPFQTALRAANHGWKRGILVFFEVQSHKWLFEPMGWGKYGGNGMDKS